MTRSGAAAILLLVVVAMAVSGCGLIQPRGALPAQPHGPTITVREGDTLDALALRYGVPVPDIVALNDLQPPYALAPGSVLVLPTTRRYVVRANDTLSGIAHHFGVPYVEVARRNDRGPPYTIYVDEALRVPIATDDSGAALPMPSGQPARTAAPVQTARAVPGPPPDDEESENLEEPEGTVSPADESANERADDLADDESRDDEATEPAAERVELSGPADETAKHEAPGAPGAAAFVTLNTLVGYDEQNVTRLLGEPNRREDDPPAQVWHYASGNCALDLYFYMELSTRTYRVLSYEVTSDHDARDVQQQCIAELFADRRP